MFAFDGYFLNQIRIMKYANREIAKYSLVFRFRRSDLIAIFLNTFLKTNKHFLKINHFYRYVTYNETVCFQMFLIFLFN